MATIIGILLGIGLLGWSMFADGGSVIFLNITALAIVLGGTIAATLVSFPYHVVLRFFLLYYQLFKLEKDKRRERLVQQLVRIGFKVSASSVAALEEDMQKEKDPYMRLGLSLLVDKADPRRIQRRFGIEIGSIKTRHQQGIQLFSFMGKVAPSFGLVGTLIGLINMLRGLTADISPETLGPAMAVALITTLYGAILAFLLFVPAAEKLRAYSQQEQALIGMVRDGIIMIRTGESGRELENMLNAYLPPRRRVSIMDQLLIEQES
mgnify:CR=1 FL=1